MVYKPIYNWGAPSCIIYIYIYITFYRRLAHRQACFAPGLLATWTQGQAKAQRTNQEAIWRTRAVSCQKNKSIGNPYRKPIGNPYETQRKSQRKPRGNHMKSIGNPEELSKEIFIACHALVPVGCHLEMMSCWKYLFFSFMFIVHQCMHIQSHTCKYRMLYL